METSSRKPLLSLNVALALVLLAAAYLLSYAPVVRWHVAARVGTPGNTYLDGYDLPVYQPVDWIIDNTPLRTPLLWWTGVWGVRREFSVVAWYRTHSDR